MPAFFFCSTTIASIETSACFPSQFLPSSFTQNGSIRLHGILKTTRCQAQTQASAVSLILTLSLGLFKLLAVVFAVVLADVCEVGRAGVIAVVIAGVIAVGLVVVLVVVGCALVLSLIHISEPTRPY